MNLNTAIKGGLDAIRFTSNLHKNSMQKNPALATHLEWYCALLDDYTRFLKEKFRDSFNIRMQVNENKELKKARRVIAKNLSTMNNKVKHLNPELFNYTPFTVYLQTIAKATGLVLRDPSLPPGSEEQKGEEQKKAE